jgi:hypothetical protein
MVICAGFNPLPFLFLAIHAAGPCFGHRTGVSGALGTLQSPVFRGWHWSAINEEEEQVCESRHEDAQKDYNGTDRIRNHVREYAEAK